MRRTLVYLFGGGGGGGQCFGGSLDARLPRPFRSLGSGSLTLFDIMESPYALYLAPRSAAFMAVSPAGAAKL